MVTNRTREARPAAVPAAKQAGEGRARWAWTEPCVWTERMLTALEEGVKGGVWFSLIDKVSAPRVLRWSFGQVQKNGGAAGVDHQTIAMYEQRLEQQTEYLARTLKEGSYQPAAVRRVMIPKPGSNEKRPLGIPTGRDRVVQKALLATIEPIFEREFAEHSYGFRQGRDCKAALRRVEQLLKAGYRWVVDADLQKFFDTILHEVLMQLVTEKIADGRVLKLLQKYLEQGVLENMRDDVADALRGYDRSPEAEASPHLWRGALPTDLPEGEHAVEVRAFDRWRGERSARTSYRLQLAEP